MVPHRSSAVTAAPPAASPSQRWPEQALPLAQELHRSLSISERDWHALKSQRPRRAAEQLAAALVQLLARDTPTNAAAGDARRQAIALAEHAVGWLKAELSDPGCPSHGR
jgi:hypothetical protein